MNEYPWLAPLMQQWQDAIANNNINAANLILSPQGAGIEYFVADLARRLVCINTQISADRSSACGLCHHCELSAANEESLNGNHPDIHWLRSPEGKAITVDMIREANQWALSSSQLGGRRIIIIEPADKMNESAANALLKTLETPPQDCIFILITQDKYQVLPTIRSRCIQTKLPAIELSVIQDWLKSKTKKPLDLLALHMYQDAPLRALDFIEQGKDKAWQQQLDLVVSAKRAQLNPNASLPLSQVSSLFKEDSLEKVTWLLYLFHEVKKAHMGVSVWQNHPSLVQVQQVFNYQDADLAYKALIDLKKQMSQFSGLNTELLMTNFLLQL